MLARRAPVARLPLLADEQRRRPGQNGNLANLNAARKEPGESNQAYADFGGVGSGLVAKGGGPLEGFTVASANHEFMPAKARLEGGRVVVWNDQVAAPVAMRYGWADNPEGANLYNKGRPSHLHFPH